MKKQICMLLALLLANSLTLLSDEVTEELIWVIERRDTTRLQHLLDEGADPNRAGWLGDTPLYVATEFGEKGVKILLAAGANPNKCTQYGHTPLWHAVLFRRKNIVKILLAAGANPTIKFGLNNKTVLDKGSRDTAEKTEIRNYIAEKINLSKELLAGAKEGNIDKMHKALTDGALINMPTEDGNTPLHLAIMSGNQNAVKLFFPFAHLINFSLKNNKGQTVFKSCRR